MNKKASTLEKAVDIGLRDREIFDWPNAQGAFSKLKEEVQELEEALSQNKSEKIYEEFSDVFFTLLQVARHLEINPEENLKFALEKYNLRYNKMFKLISDDGLEISIFPLEKLEVYWQKAKIETSTDLTSLLKKYSK